MEHIVKSTKHATNKIRKTFIKMPIIPFCIIFTVINLFFTKQILGTNGVNKFVLVALVELTIEGLIILLLVLAERKHWGLERKFLIAAIGIGALFIVLLPPGQSPDEISHFRRAYGVTEGEIIADKTVNEQGAIGSEIPVETYMLNSDPSPGTYRQISEWLQQEKSGETSEQPYTNTALYNFICYIPQILAAFLGKALGMSVIWIAYLMRIINFVVWIVLTYFAIKIIPKFKMMALFIALLPITLQEATSLSPDAITIGLSLFLVAYVLYLAYGKKRNTLKKPELAILYVMAALIGFCKIVYFPLVLLYLVIPAERFGSKKLKRMHLLMIATLTIAVNLSWLMISSKLLIEFNPGVNSGEQVAGIIGNPSAYIMVMFRTLSTEGYSWLQNMLGTVLGSFTFRLPTILFVVSLSFATILVAQRDERLTLRRFDRVVFLAVFVMISMLIFASLYVQWTAVGAAKIDGIQGRYFLPIALLIPVLVNRTRASQPHMKLISQNAVLCYSIFVNIVALVTIFAQNA